MNSDRLGPLVQAFFLDYLQVQRRLRPSSVRSYRDALRLFLQFVARERRRAITRLSLQDLTFDRVLGFLRYLEEERGNHIRTRNQRLALLHAFFTYLAQRDPEMLGVAERVAAIPSKRVSPPEAHYLDREQISSLFARLPQEGSHAARDRALLLFLYNTGARVQEAADLRVEDLELTPPSRASLHGKGDKWRCCPLWAETTEQLRRLLEQRGTRDSPSAPVFVSRTGSALSRFGIYKIVRRHASFLDASTPRGSNRRQITPHVLRHTTAVHLLEAGVDVNVIRGWLGHVSLDTTQRYAEITAKIKQSALETCESAVAPSSMDRRRAVWRDDNALLDWLKSL